MIEVYFSLGSNLGDRRSNLATAVSAMEKSLGSAPKTVSEIIETEPVGFAAREIFLNMAARFDFPEAGQSHELHCRRLLAVCKEIERSMGRRENPLYDAAGRRIYSSRPIDIDILLYGGLRLDTPDLTVPHKEMAVRDFVKIPLREIASDEVLRTFPWIMD